MYSNPFLIRLRSALRSMGFLHLIQTSPLYRRISSGYESRFDSAMMACLEPGMRVFDIGANVGYYTSKFAEAVGPSGEVHAFEPVPGSAAKLRELQAEFPWVQVHQCALADQPGELMMNADETSTLPTNRIAFTDEDLVQAITVPVVTLDHVLAEFGVPSLMKIDVEGYELNVLRGGLLALRNTQLRHVFVEVHFAILEARGLAMASDDIHSIFEDTGFHCKFTDFSHLHAIRV